MAKGPVSGVSRPSRAFGQALATAKKVFVKGVPNCSFRRKILWSEANA